MVFVFLIPELGLGQTTTMTLTSSATSTGLSNNPVFGCPVCAQGNPFAAFPDTSQPIFAGDPRAAQLPAIIANALPPNNQFGAGIPAGSSTRPFSASMPFSLSEGGVSMTIDNRVQFTPGRGTSVTMRIDQVVPGGNFNGFFGGSGGDQNFSIVFSSNSLTDPDGNLVGDANGNFRQILDGDTLSGTSRFNTGTGFSGTNLGQNQTFFNPFNSFP